MAYRGILNEFTETIIQKLISKFSEVKERTVRLYLDEFEKYKTELEKKDPFQYANFEELEQAVDRVKGNKLRVNRDIKIDVQKDDIVAEDDNVVIYRGDSQDRCILYGQGYTFCISRRGAGNMFSHYRGGKGSTFYFIYFKKKPKEDNDHIMVLDHTKNGYEWTFANNDTKKVAGGWDEIVSKYKELAPYKDILVNKKLNRRERSELKSVDDFINNPSVKKFIKFDFDMRSRVLKMSVDLDDDIFKILSKDLINEFLSIGPNLTPFQVASLNEKQKEWYLKNRRVHVDQLIQDYLFLLNELDLTIDKIQTGVKKDLAEAEHRVSIGSYDFRGLPLLVKLPSNIPQEIDDDFICTHCSLTSLEGSPNIVTGNFKCDSNRLTTLKGAPSSVSGSFFCRYNYLTSLEGGPNSVGGVFDCSRNELTSLKGAPINVESFSCSNNNLTSLVGAPNNVDGFFECVNNDNLTSLEGAPSSVGGGFYCGFNKNLTSLKGAPSNVGGNFNCFNSNLTSLEGAPSNVGGHFNCFNSNLTSLEGAPSNVGGNFNCFNSNLTSLKGSPISVGGHFNCFNSNLTSLEGAPSNVGGGFYCNPQINGREFTRDEILAAMEDSKRKQANSMIKENRRFTQIELITNMRYWF